jgi:hypothetical protein
MHLGPIGLRCRQKLVPLLLDGDPSVCKSLEMSFILLWPINRNELLLLRLIICMAYLIGIQILSHCRWSNLWKMGNKTICPAYSTRVLCLSSACGMRMKNGRSWIIRWSSDGQYLHVVNKIIDEKKWQNTISHEIFESIYWNGWMRRQWCNSSEKGMVYNYVNFVPIWHTCQ